MESTTDYKIENIVKRFKDLKNFNKKKDVIELLMELKSSLEFNSTINWDKLLNELGNLYKDPSPYYNKDRYTLDNLTLEDFEDTYKIFVFGSNNKGYHQGGSAKFAMDDLGAIHGQAKGLQGQSFAITTVNFNDKGERSSLTLEEIEKEIDDFLVFAYENKQYEFYMSKIACGSAGYTVKDIGPLFSNKVIPENVVLPFEFVSPVNYSEYLYSASKSKFFRIKDINTLIVLDTNTNSINQFHDDDIIRYLPIDMVISTEDDWKTATQYVINQLINI
jgi:hypothetical protein